MVHFCFCVCIVPLGTEGDGRSCGLQQQPIHLAKCCLSGGLDNVPLRCVPSRWRMPLRALSHWLLPTWTKLYYGRNLSLLTLLRKIHEEGQYSFPLLYPSHFQMPWQVGNCLVCQVLCCLKLGSLAVEGFCMTAAAPVL